MLSGIVGVPVAEMSAVALHYQADINKLIGSAHGARRAVLQVCDTPAFKYWGASLPQQM